MKSMQSRLNIRTNNKSNKFLLMIKLGLIKAYI
jgi:hypothetical protein